MSILQSSTFLDMLIFPGQSSMLFCSIADFLPIAAPQEGKSKN